MAEFEFVFHPEAESEFLAGFQWYWDRDHATADAFDDAVMAGIGPIRRNPSVWPASPWILGWSTGLN